MIPRRPSPSLRLALGRAARPWRRALAAAAMVALAAGAARAASMVPPAGYRPKDFSLVKKDGVYHLFYILNNTLLSFDQTEVAFGHAVSEDLAHWTQRDSVLAVDPAGWDNSHVWAPSVFFDQGLWWMTYAGVSDRPGVYRGTQRIGLAVSSDLDHWTRVGDGPVLDASQLSWAWWRPLDPSMAFRDPFVMRDPSDSTRFLMYLTATPQIDSTTTVVGVVRSDDRTFTSWSDVKPLWITHASYTYNVLTESPHLFEHDGLWFLCMSTSGTPPIVYYTTTDPTGDYWEWRYHGALGPMLGVPTNQWFASEHLRDGLDDLFAYCEGDGIDIMQMNWSARDSFKLAEPPLLHVVSMAWSTPSAMERDTVDLTLDAVNWTAGVPSLEAVVLGENGGETPVAPESLGLASHPALTSGSTTLRFTATRWPPTSDTSTVTRLVVRTTDQTATTGMLSIGPPPPTHLLPEREPVRPPVPDSPDSSNGSGSGGITHFGALPRLPIGGGAGVVVQLPHAGEVRVDVFDLQGRRVRNLAARALPRGTTVLPWDGRDDAGAPVRRGLYFVRLATGGRAWSARLLVAG